MSTLDFPQKNKKRALRRMQRQRKIDRAIKVAENHFWDADPAWKSLWAKRHADNMKSCGCWMCNNPRKVFHQLSFDQIKQKEKERLSCDE